MRTKISGLALRRGVSRLAGVTAAALSFKDFDGVIPEEKIEFPVERHGG